MIRLINLEKHLEGTEIFWDVDAYSRRIEDGGYSTHGGVHDSFEAVSKHELYNILCGKLWLDVGWEYDIDSSKHWETNVGDGYNTFSYYKDRLTAIELALIKLNEEK